MPMTALPIPEAIWRRLRIVAAGDDIRSLGNYGGFSGAQLWRVSGPPPWCVRRWPEGTTVERVREVHRHIVGLCDAGLSGLPRPIPLHDEDTVVTADDSVWEIAPWLPGRADFAQTPTETRLRRALQTLARIHQVWGGSAWARGTNRPPGIQRRLQRCRELAEGQWQHLARLVENLRPSLPDGIPALVDVTARLLPLTLGQLSSISDGTCYVQPCIRDIRREHLLFEGEELTGIVDFDAIGIDCVASDLARLIPSLVGDDASRWASALESYEVIRPLDAWERKSLAAYDLANIVLSGAQWLTWTVERGRTFEDPGQVAARMEECLARAKRLARVRGV